MDQVISVNFSPSPILQFEPFEPGTHSELESSLLDDHQKIEIKKISDEQIPNDRSGNWTIKDFFIGIVIEAIAQTFARFASQFLTIPWKFRINIDLSNTQKSLDIIRIKFRYDYVLMYITNTILQHYFDNSSFFKHRRKVLYVLMKPIILAKVKIEFIRTIKSKCTSSLWPRHA